MPSLEEAMRQSENGIEQLDDGLITPVNDVFMINPETRIIEVPESERLFGVNFDKDVEKKYFKCPKVVGNNVDLSKHKIYIVYQKANENITTLMGEVGKYWCEDVKVDETGDYIEFSWLLSGNVLEEQGFVAFKVVAVYTDTETGELKTRWNTVPSIGLVRFTLSDGEEIAEQHADVITQLLQRMDAVEDIATPEAMKGYVEQYLKAHPTELDETLTDSKKAAPANLVGRLKEGLSNLLEEGNQILDWKNAKVVNGYFTSISDFKSSDNSRTVIIPVDYSKGDTITIHRDIIGKRLAYGYTSKENPKIGDNLDYVGVNNDAETIRLKIKSDTKNILLYYYNSTLDNYDSDDILASIMVQYGKVYTGYEPYGEPRGTKDIINKINGNSEKLISAVYNSPSIFDDVSNPISKGDHFYLYVKDIVGAKYSDIEFYFFRSDNTYKRVIHNINIGELYAITADEDYTKYRIRIVVESTTSNDMIYAIYNIFQSNGISAINISAKVYDLALDNNKKVEQLTANNLNTCNIFRKVVACGDSYTAGYITDKLGNVHNVNEEYAWPHYMETITGNTWVNCGHSGANAYTWQTAERGLPKAKASGKAQAYILGLMINDSSTDSTRNLKLGTISDIGINEMSFYAQYTKVIKELFKISPKAKVFIETCPKIEGDRYVGYNQAVHDIYDALKSNYPNLHLLDLFKHYSMYTNTSLTKDSLSGHYTAIGYQQFAQILSVILSSYINEHISDFQDVAFIEYDN